MNQSTSYHTIDIPRPRRDGDSTSPSSVYLSSSEIMGNMRRRRFDDLVERAANFETMVLPVVGKKESRFISQRSRGVTKPSRPWLSLYGIMVRLHLL